MLGEKSASKKVLLVGKAGGQGDSRSNLMRRFKSQENYAMTKNTKELKESKDNKEPQPQKKQVSNTNSNNTPMTPKNKNRTAFTSKITLNEFSFLSKSKELIRTSNANKTGSLFNINKRIISITKANNKSPGEEKNKSTMNNFIQNKPKTGQKEPTMVSKIMNDESIQELNTEENINSQDDDDLGFDEMKSSELISDFYTNSIGEASESVVDKGRKLINCLPQPFVKSIKNKFKEEENKIQLRHIGKDIRVNSNSKNKINNNSKSPKKVTNFIKPQVKAQSEVTSLKKEISTKQEEIVEEKEEKDEKVINLVDSPMSMSDSKPIIVELEMTPNPNENQEINTPIINPNRSIEHIQNILANTTIQVTKENTNFNEEEKLPLQEMQSDNKDSPSLNTINIESPLSNNLTNLNNITISQSKSNNNITNLSEIPSIENLQRKLLLAAKKGDRDLFLESLEKVLSDPQGEINFQDDSGWTALHHACDEGNLKIVDILINTNLDVDSKTKNKKTPLHLAISHGYFDISKMLIESGCCINSLDDEKNTPIHICSSIGHIELLKFLLDKFPQADTKNIYGKTPYDLAKKDEIKQILSDYLKRTESKYHKVHIHTTNNKSANVLIKNMPNYTEICHKTKPEIKTPTKNQLLNSTPTFKKDKNMNSINNLNCLSNASKNNNKVFHNKYGSTSDFDSKLESAFQNNNININISANLTDISNPNIKVFNLNNVSSGSSNKVKVTVETKLKGQTKNSVNCLTNSNMTSSGKLNKVNSLNDKNRNNVNNTNKSSSSTKNVLKHTLTSVRLTNTNIVNKIHSKEKGNNKNIQNIQNNTSRNMAREREIERDFSPNVNTNSNVSVEKSNRRHTTAFATSSKKEKSCNRIGIDLTNERSLYKVLNTMTNEESNLTKIEEQNYSKRQSDGAILTESNNLGHNLSNNNQGSLIDEEDENPSNSISNTNNQEGVTNSNLTNNTNSCSMEEDRIGPSSFICHALLGKGSFGEVYLVQKKNSGTLYAMKVLSKDKITVQNLVKYAMTERNVLSLTNHPFIVKLNYSFQTSDKLFLILDYCPGGDLAEHLARENRFSEERAKIYLCELVLALENLHKRDIIFRDLKPDNVVIDSEGHALLTDFGLSKEGVFDSKSAKSFCGSIAYLAPEMLKRAGHGKAVDWYLLGVLFYEMLVGIPPYFTNNKEQLFRNIEKAELQIPKFVSEEAGSLLRDLLQRDPLRRLGSGKYDAVDIKKHKYFKDINWNDVYQRKLKPPVPAIRNRVLQQFARPRMFEDSNNNGPVFSLHSQLDSHFDGWSFINNENNQQISMNNTTK